MKNDVVIVGGGLAGLVCAHALSGRGLKVCVLERSERLGGRAQSWRDEKTGDVVDLGPHILLSTYPNMLSFLAELGTSDLVHWDEGAMIRQMRGTESFEMRFSWMPPPFHFLPSLLLNRRLGFKDVVCHGPLFARVLAENPLNFNRYDHLTAIEVLRLFGVTEGAIEEMWRFVGLAILNLPLEECSGAAFFRFLRFLAGRKDYRIGFAKVGLGELFADQSQAQIEKNGGTVRLLAPVKRAITESGRVTSLELSDGTQVEGRAFVLALPPQDVANLLPSDFRAATGIGPVEKLEPCAYLSVYLWFDRKVSEQAFWARAYAREDLNCDFYDLRYFRAGWEIRSSVITSNIIYSQRLTGMSDEKIIELTLNELYEQLPDAREAQVVHARVNRIPMAIHCPRPGTESLRAPPRIVKENLYLAGDWIRTGFPSSMESACCAGFLAAEAVLEDLGRPTQLSHDAATIPSLTRANAKVWNQIYRVLGMAPA